jgi:acetyl esterase
VGVCHNEWQFQKGGKIMKRYYFWIMSVSFIMLITFCSCSNNYESQPGDNIDPKAESSFKPSDIITYKTINGRELKAHIFYPADINDDDTLPALIYFHGGGWNEFDAKEGYELCNYFASIGMIAISFEYRLANFADITPVECITDAKSAVRWTREHAYELYINPDQIIASGGSSGGHLAACTGILEEFDETGEDLAVSSCPNAIILFSSVLNTVGNSYFASLLQNRTAVINCSPLDNIRQGLPPTVLFHGTLDRIASYSDAQTFTELMVQNGNQCELYSFNTGHDPGITNSDETREYIRDFLVSLGYLAPDSSNDGE